MGANDEPLDLLDPSTSRAMMRTAAGRSAEAGGSDFPVEGGRMVINEEDAPLQRGGPKPKRKRGGGIDNAASDDSDFDDLHGIAGATAALRVSGRSQAAGSTAAQSGVRSAAGRSFAGKSFAGEALRR